jgi:hypothetical protein
MRNKPGPVTHTRLRWIARQVQRPRLRPGWRIVVMASAAAAAAALLYLGEHAAINALVGGELGAPAPAAAGHTISREDERALDALLARFDAERKEDEERARKIAAEHIDPMACELAFHVDVPFCDEHMYQALEEQRAERARAGEEIGRALERWAAGPRPSPSATAVSRR